MNDCMTAHTSEFQEPQAILYSLQIIIQFFLYADTQISPYRIPKNKSETCPSKVEGLSSYTTYISYYSFQEFKNAFFACRTTWPAVGTSCRSLAICACLLHLIYYWNLKTWQSLWLAENECCRSHMKSCRTVTDDRRLFHALVVRTWWG